MTCRPPPGVRVWPAAGATDMPRGFDGLARQAQEVLGRDPSRSTSLAGSERALASRHCYKRDPDLLIRGTAPA